MPVGAVGCDEGDHFAIRRRGCTEKVLAREIGQLGQAGSVRVDDEYLRRGGIARDDRETVRYLETRLGWGARTRRRRTTDRPCCLRRVAGRGAGDFGQVGAVDPNHIDASFKLVTKAIRSPSGDQDGARAPSLAVAISVRSDPSAFMT